METQLQPPPLARDPNGALAQASLINTVAWFLDHDPRVSIMRHPHVEELFQWKQRQSPAEAAAYTFDSAEDRFAVGIFQALAMHRSEAELHDWIAELLAALDESAKLNEALTNEYKLDGDKEDSALTRAAALPSDDERSVFLTACWLEALCTAEARVLGWIYQNLYDRPFHPNNFAVNS